MLFREPAILLQLGWAPEAAVTRSLIEQVLAVAGPQTIDLLLADALYADGPLLAWLKYQKGIDALVCLPEDRWKNCSVCLALLPGKVSCLL